MSPTPSKTNNINLKLFNMITRISEAKTLVKHVSCNCKRKFSSTAFQIKKGIMINVNASVKSIVRVKAIIVGILAYVLRIVSI